MKNRQSGLSLVELMIALVVAGGLVLTFSLLYTTILQLMTSAQNTASASNYAYSVLRKYVNSGPASAWFECDDISAPGAFNDNGRKNGSINDGHVDIANGEPNPNSLPPTGSFTPPAASIIPGGTGAVPAEYNLPPISNTEPASYTVYARAPYGCTEQDWGRPVKLQVDIKYGKTPSRIVSHAAYASF